MADVIPGDDEDNGGGAESHPLLGPDPAAAARRGHHDRSNGALNRSQGALFEVALQTRYPRAEQLHQTAAEL